MIQGAGSPVAIHPNIRDSESSMILANSSKFSQIQQTFTGNSHNVRQILSNQSQVRQSSSFSRKSIRKQETTEGDV